jgi:predicted TIM-barrel fold metal-dependent hydrolase
MADENENNPAKKAEQNDPNGSVLKSRKVDLLCGDAHTISFWQPSVIIDSHMHIESGNCAPLPFVHGATPVLGALKLERGTIETAGEILCTIVDFILLKPVFAKYDKPNEAGDTYRKSGIRQMIPMSRNSTIKIAKEFVEKRIKAAHSLFKAQQQYQSLSNLVFCSVVMPMDMEYAHIDGYFGIKVYNAIYADEDTTKDPIHYWYPRHGFWSWRGNSYEKIPGQLPLLPEGGQSQKDFYSYEKSVNSQGITGAYHDTQGNTKWINITHAAPCVTSDKETRRYERWSTQLKYTELALFTYPLQLLPLFHYDPRRWQLKGNQEAFNHVGDSGLFLGFKMYTAQGYRPWDPRLPVLADFYAECCKRGTPIMNHCTPAGASTFDREDYFDFTHSNDTEEDRAQKTGYEPILVGPYPGVPMEDPCKRLNYFNEHFVAPDAWRRVLDRTVNDISLCELHLCLAHFGGNTSLGRDWGIQIIKMIKEKKYPNLYADISSSFADEDFRAYFIRILQGADGEYIKDHILFGTDWYMTLLGGVEYREFCENAKNDLDNIDTSLWPRFTQYNPYRFYRLDEDGQIDRIARNIIERRKAKGIIKILKKTIDEEEVVEINKLAAYIRQANKSYPIYEETTCTV